MLERVCGKGFSRKLAGIQGERRVVRLDWDLRPSPAVLSGAAYFHEKAV
jgi:hypothetical protein